MFFELREVSVGGSIRSASQLLRITQRNLLWGAEPRVIAFLQRFHLLRRNSHAFGALNMVLRAVAASVDQGDAQIHSLIHLAIERSPYTGIESKKVSKHRGTMRQRLLNI